MFWQGGKIVGAGIFENLANRNVEYKESLLYLSSHSPIVVLYQFISGMYIFYGVKEKRENKYYIPIWFIGIFGIIYGINDFIVSAFMGILLVFIVDLKVNTSSRLTKSLVLLDEYSYSLYLGHTTAMFIFSKLQEIYHFSMLRLAILDFAGTFILTYALHNYIEKIRFFKLKKELV